MEDYLEAIHHLQARKGAARSKDIADMLGVTRSSVTGALRALSARKLINYSPYDLVTLTREGEQVAADVVRRHTVLKRFLTQILGMESEQAEQAACGLEHELSDTALQRLGQLVDFLQACPRCSVALGSPVLCPLDKRGQPISCTACVERGAKQQAKRRFGPAVPLNSLKKEGLVRIVKLPRTRSLSARLRESGVLPGLTALVAERSEEGVTLLVAGLPVRIPALAAQNLTVQPLNE